MEDENTVGKREKTFFSSNTTKEQKNNKINNILGSIK